MTAALIIAGWALCGFLSYGLTLAYHQREFTLIANRNRNRDRGFAFLTSLLGPLSLFVALLMCREHGFMWRLPPRKL